MGSKGILIVAVLLAAALRLPDLAARPMHADEAIHADKLGTLLETGRYVYDPSEYHGSTLYYLTLPVALLRGESRYVDVDEVTLRSVPAILGVLLVIAPLAARSWLGASAAAMAALLTAVSPAMVFYSRYYIHETPLVLFTFGFFLACHSCASAPGVAAWLLAGASLGLMLATKETAVLALGAVVIALLVMAVVDRPRTGRDRGAESARMTRNLLLGILIALFVSFTLQSAFFANPRAILDSLKAYGVYWERAGAASVHAHPFAYYLGLLSYSSAPGAPLFSEASILALAAFGTVAAWRGSPRPGTDPRFLRSLSVYTVVLLLLYSAIPYKTPWCVLGFLHGMILLAGSGAVALWRALPRGRARALLVVALTAVTAHLAFQAWSGGFRYAADPRNPYVYAHTSTDVFEIVRRLEDLARVHPDGIAMPVQVVSRANLWPLPFYLRAFPGVTWWTGVADDARSAPVILATPDMEPALVRKLYDLPPPGERELYVSVFDRPVELRPQVELRGYAQHHLFEQFRRHEDASSTSPSAERK